MTTPKKKSPPVPEVDPVKVPGKVESLATMSPEKRAEMEKLYARTAPRDPVRRRNRWSGKRFSREPNPEPAAGNEEPASPPSGDGDADE
jgi:hypothetical protein